MTGSVGPQILVPWQFTHCLKTQIELDNVSNWKNSYINSSTQKVWAIIGRAKCELWKHSLISKILTEKQYHLMHLSLPSSLSYNCLFVYGLFSSPECNSLKGRYFACPVHCSIISTWNDDWHTHNRHSINIYWLDGWLNFSGKLHKSEPSSKVWKIQVW